MSISNYYRMFFALTRYSVKDYVRRSHISLAACDIVSGKSNILDIAIKYTFENSDTFSRAFKRIVGCNIIYAWQQLSKWLKDSKYSLGYHQWMEEHLHFNEEFEFEARIDLYMPIKLK